MSYLFGKAASIESNTGRKKRKHRSMVLSNYSLETLLV